MKKAANKQQLLELQHAADIRCSELSPRELYIARLMAWGYTPCEIADRLFLSPLTVRQHIKNIYCALDIHRDTDLTRWYIFREYGIADNAFKRIATIIMLVVMLASCFELNCNARGVRSSARITVGRGLSSTRGRRTDSDYSLTA